MTFDEFRKHVSDICPFLFEKVWEADNEVWYCLKERKIYKYGIIKWTDNLVFMPIGLTMANDRIKPCDKFGSYNGDWWVDCIAFSHDQDIEIISQLLVISKIYKNITLKVKKDRIEDDFR